ncbi:hypothetical protein ACNJYD_08925 [Bradyrhizobium sp. DASA03005]|uniref:hypothetical protein n=1 Tax=Bradyrhizobium sp. SPXBL-02 TaxID=3395912 RepID=UPI003F6ED274
MAVYRPQPMDIASYLLLRRLASSKDRVEEAFQHSPLLFIPVAVTHQKSPLMGSPAMMLGESIEFRQSQKPAPKPYDYGGETCRQPINNQYYGATKRERTPLIIAKFI